MRNHESERFAWGERFLDEFHALDLLELAHGLRGFGGDLTEAVVELAERGDFLLLVLVGGRLAFVGFVFEAEVVGVVAAPFVEFAVSDFVNFFDDFVHELAVMGDEENGAGVVFEVVLEPEEGDEVEVVGGFVEHEEVGLHHEEASEVGAHDPATAEFACGSIEVGATVAEAGEHALGFCVDLRVGEGLVFGVCFEVIGSVDIAFGFEFAEAGFEGGDFAGAAGGDVEDGFVADGLGFLGKEADHCPRIAFDGAGVRFVAFEDEGEEGAFAGAVGSDEGDAFPVVDLHTGFFEEGDAVGFFQVANREHFCRIIRGNGAHAFVFCWVEAGARGCGAWRVGVTGTGYAKIA